VKIGAISDLSARVERIDELGNTLWEQDFPGIYSAENERAESFDECPIQFNRRTNPLYRRLGRLYGSLGMVYESPGLLYGGCGMMYGRVEQFDGGVVWLYGGFERLDGGKKKAGRLEVAPASWLKT
jgi:hypothetical protein